MDRPLFTVATLCYNHEPYLDDYFSGLLAQDYRNVQLIIHDDSSTDGSWEKIQSYVPEVTRKFAEVICERSRTNIGMWGSYLRVTDPAIVRGEFLSVLESDDYYYPNRISKMVQHFVDYPDHGAVHSATQHVSELNIPLHVHRCDRSVGSGYLFDHLLKANFVNQCSLAFQTHVLQQVNVRELSRRNYKVVDYAVNLAISRITQFGYVDDILVAYRVRPGSASRPRDPLQRYEFGKSLGKVAIDAARDANVIPETIKGLLTSYHYNVFRSAPLAGAFNDFDESLQWLIKNNADLTSSLSDRLRRVLFGSKLLRGPAQKLYYISGAATLRSTIYQRLWRKATN